MINISFNFLQDTANTLLSFRIGSYFDKSLEYLSYFIMASRCTVLSRSWFEADLKEQGVEGGTEVQ